EPAGGIRGEVGVVGEDPLGCLELLELHQEAVSADEGSQRIEGLHAVGPLRRQVGVGQRRHAEIGEDGVHRGAPETAFGLGHGEEPAYWKVSIWPSVTARMSSPACSLPYQTTVASRAASSVSRGR